MLKKSKFFLVPAFITVALIWGMSFVFTKIALEELEAIEVLAVRWAIPPIIYGLLALFGVVRLSFRGKPIKELILLVICEPLLYATFETPGIKLSTASESSIFVAAIPLAVILLQQVFLRIKPSGLAKLGVFVGFAGVLTCIVFTPGLSIGSKWLGYLLLTLTVITGAAYSVLTSKLSDSFSTVEISFAMTLAGGVFFNIQNLLMGNGLHAYRVLLSGGRISFALLFLGIGCGFVSYYLFNYSLSKSDPVVVSCICTNAINIVGVVAGIVLFADPWGLYTIIGVLLTSAGIILTAISDRSAAGGRSEKAVEPGG